MGLFGRLTLVATLMVALAALAPTFAATNDLTQIGIAVHSDGTNDLKQIGIALHDGYTYVAGDGSVRTVPGDGSVRLISIGGGTQESVCFHNATIVDGNSNTIFLGENVGLSVTPTFLSGPSSARSVLDGSSNTISLRESPSCLGGVTGIGETAGDPTNEAPGIHVGDGASFDLCTSSALVSTIADGTSNTITFAETRNGACFDNIVPPSNVSVFAAVAPEPDSWVLLLPAVLGLTGLGHAVQRTRSHRG
jgi:hypothetical protein